MVTDSRVRVLRLLDAGWTVARIMDATSWPRRQIELLAASAGMLPRRSTDTWINTKPRETRTPSRLEQLVDDGLRSAQSRTRQIAGRIQRDASMLEHLLTQERLNNVRAGYDVAAVRKWAREQGLNPPVRGRYLPKEIVAAWRRAHPEHAREGSSR